MSEYKVAKIVDNHTLVITAGKKQGIKRNQVFHIIGKSGVTVTDPDTGEKIGTLDEIKGDVFARVVYPNMTVAETKAHSVFDNQSGALFTSALTAPQYDKLNVDVDQITGGLGGEDSSPIQIGDIALTDDPDEE